MNRLKQAWSAAAGKIRHAADHRLTTRCSAVILLTLLVTSCTSSKFVIGPLYNRLDDRMMDQFDELGDFTEQQRAAFAKSVGTFHVWHRQSELPRYSTLIETLASSIADADTSASDISLWMNTVEQYSQAARDCNPVNFSVGLMKTLSDEQWTVIEQRFEEERKEDLERYAGKTPEERIERRMNNMRKWAARIDLDFTPTQRAMLLSTLKQQISMREQYYRLSDEWNRRLFELARTKNNPDFDEQMRVHLGNRWNQLEKEYPEQWQANRDLWENTVLRFIQSMTAEQRETVSRWLTRLGSTLAAISRDEPSFQVIEDPSLGCLVDPEKT